ncbi:MAG: MBL fold metallo-hydrolase [Gammaproteobacteria bacterium]|nr:MBL fold metallo-hydrolase [Gammaproteobacteria bacterium]
MATLRFLGAVNDVTGSCCLLETDRARVLLDCGLYQGSNTEEAQNARPFPFDATALDAVVLSHAHLDHSGRLPQLMRNGCRATIHLTPASYDLLEIMLKDSAFLNERDAEWRNRRALRAGKPPIEPLYTSADVTHCLSFCQGVRYGARQRIADGVEVCFRDAGHILGSAIVELYIHEQGRETKLLFSGDLGNSFSALLRDPEIVNHADVVLLESTYGDHDHRSLAATLDELHTILQQAADSGGNVLIPSFAVGRTQELLFRLGEFYQAGQLPQQIVFLDSPMAIAATEVYHRYQAMFNRADAAQLARSHAGTLHTFLPPLYYSRSAEESMRINSVTGGTIIIAGSGMCDGGRIRHHLKHNLWRRGAHVIIVGYQALGTPGRALIDGAETLHLLGEDIAVKASIHTLGGFSAHAGQTQLRDWLRHLKPAKPRLYLVHGEATKKAALQQVLRQDGWQPEIPAYDQVINL